MENITRKLEWLHRQITKDEKKILDHKNKIIKEIKKDSPLLEKNNLNMPQYSEKYLKEMEEEKKPKIMEGYLASLLKLSDSLPFKSLDSKMTFTLDKNTYIKVLKEVERIKLGEDVEPELLNIESNFEVQIGEILVTFNME